MGAPRNGYPVLDVAQVARLERLIEEDGLSLAALMERAGRSVAGVLMEGKPPPARCLVVAGSGNNGGDGWVVARCLASQGVETVLVTPVRADGLTAEPARTKACELMRLYPGGLPLLRLAVGPDSEDMARLLRPCDTVVDAVLGTGFSGERVREPYACWIRAVNEWRAASAARTVLAVDVPSGLSAQTGAAADPCIEADITVTMLSRKPGLMRAQGPSRCGKVVLARIAGIQAFLPRL